jgi:hypothetical protein
MGHPKIGDHDLIPTGSGPAQLSERDAPILGFIGVPTPKAQIARQGCPNGRLVVDDQCAPQACAGDFSS